MCFDYFLFFLKVCWKHLGSKLDFGGSFFWGGGMFVCLFLGNVCFFGVFLGEVFFFLGGCFFLVRGCVVLEMMCLFRG